jgi:hypothetical protein
MLFNTPSLQKQLALELLLPLLKKTVYYDYKKNNKAESSFTPTEPK